MMESTTPSRLGTAAKLLLVLSLIMLPIGGLLVWSSLRNLESAGASIASQRRETFLVRGSIAGNVRCNCELRHRKTASTTNSSTVLRGDHTIRDLPASETQRIEAGVNAAAEMSWRSSPTSSRRKRSRPP